MDSADLQKKLNEWWIQRHQLVLAIGFLVSSALLLFFGAYRFWQISSELQVTIESQEVELTQVEQRATLLNNITPEDRAGYDLVQQALPRFKEPLLVMRTLEAISLDTGVSLGEYDLNPGVVSTESAESPSGRGRGSSSQWQSLRLEIELSGSFQQLTTAIDSMEQSLPLMEITDLRIAPARRADATDLSNLLYLATLQLESYYADIDPVQAARGGAQQITPGQRRAREELEEMRYWFESTGVIPQDTPSGTTDLFQLTE